MKYLFVLFAAIIVLVASQFQPEAFFQASQTCFERENLSEDNRLRFHRLNYPDNRQVHRYIYCVATTLDVWNDTTGFDVDQVTHMYRNRANSTILTPIVTQCNRRLNHQSKETWCYKAFMCLLNSPIGQWFREDQRTTSSRRFT